MNIDPPDFSFTCNESFGSLMTNFRDLSQAQQRNQMSLPFQAHGLHWILAIEKDPTSANNNANGQQHNQEPQQQQHGVDVSAYIYNLNVPIEEDQREDFGIKGNIRLGQRVFNGSTGTAFNLPGKTRPAHHLYFPKRVFFRLRSGRIEEEAEISMYLDTNQHNGGTTFFGGYYDTSWTGGVGALLLENHTFDPVRDGSAIEISVKFELPAPEAFWRHDDDN